MGKYDDIISLERPVSEKYPPMPMSDRAAQFSPFAALTGYDAAIEETGRKTEMFIEPDENMKALINERLLRISEHIDEKPVVTIVYFCRDERKSGGRYEEITGVVKKIDGIYGNVVMEDGAVISVDFIKEITCEE